MSNFDIAYDTLTELLTRLYETEDYKKEYGPSFLCFDPLDPAWFKAIETPPDKDASIKMHKFISSRLPLLVIALIDEAWRTPSLKKDDRLTAPLLEGRLKVKDLPLREEGIMVSMRSEGELRIGWIGIDRKEKRLTRGPLLDPKVDKLEGRFAS